MGKLEGEFAKAGATVYAISNEGGDELQKMKVAEKLGDHFIFLSDKDAKAADKYMGHYPDGSALKPGTFVIDKQGKIAFSYVEENYANRAESAKVLEAVRAAAK